MILFLKASIPSGARWITVHPNGKDSKGQPILIQPQADGSARVIGGAGGSLNYLKLRGVRSQSEYKKEAAARKDRQKQERKEQRARDKEAGILESKAKAKEAVRAQRQTHEREFINTVAEAMGWDKQQIEFDEDKHQDLSETALNKLRAQHHREVLSRATEAVELQRQVLISDADARMEAGLGEVPLDAPESEVLSVNDLDPIKSGANSLGFAADYKGRAEKAGLTEDELKAEVNEVRNLSDEDRKAAIARGATAKMVKQELEAIREPVISELTKTKADPKVAVEMLRAQKKLNQIRKQAREASAEIDKSTVEPKAYVLEYTEDPETDAKIAEDINNDLRTVQTRAFLSEFEKLAGNKPEETLGKYIGVGAYNSINSLALAVGGDALMDRSVVDVLGVAGAAQVLARRIHNDLPDQVDHITAGMQDFHLHHYMQLSEKALSEARDFMDAAKEVELGEAANGADLQAAQELNARRRDAVSNAQKTLGQALGEMETNAAIVLALKQGKRDNLEVSLGKASIETAIQQARAIGLQRGDYKIENVAGNTFLTVNANGMGRLSNPIQREDIEQLKTNLSIINGEHDEDGWLPLGVANRPDLVMDVPAGVAPRLAQPFELGEDLEQSLRDYIGGRAADGDSPADIVADIQSAEFFQKAGEGRSKEYGQALDKVAPMRDAKGKVQRVEKLTESFDKYADDYVANRYGGDRSTINKQQFKVDQKSVDALHRALAATPEGTAAYKQIGELDHHDQRALREFFYRNVAKESPESGELRTNLERLQANEPEKETTDMFGDTVVNPEWEAWRQDVGEKTEAFNASSLTWAKYVTTMRGNEKAYESMQDMIRSKVSKTFVDTYNKLNPETPIKIGKSVIRNNLDHLDATDPAAREDRMARERALIDSLRERVQGRYASGSVTEKLGAARERQEALEQAQMGFFSTQDDMFGGGEEAPKEITLSGDERYSIGHEAERQIAGMMGVVGKNFKPGEPLKLWNPSMSGGNNWPRQRSIKLIEANKRIGLHLGAGSGKTLVGLGGFSHLHEKGKVKRGIFVVPSVVQGQFGGEALRYLEPGKFNWHCEPGAKREDRIAAYKGKDHDFFVVTHQSFRDDLLHLGSKAEGVTPDVMRDRVDAMTHAERKEWMRGIMEKEGIGFDYMAVDEGHNLLDRKGKEDSGMSQMIGAYSANTPYYVSMTADPIRNDASELFSALQKVAPDRYTDRAAFLRKYGADTPSARDSLKREMARYFYAHNIDPGVKTAASTVDVKLSDAQQSSIKDLDKDIAMIRLARMSGKVDIEAAKRVSPSAFNGVDESKHEDVARSIQSAIGIVRESSLNRIINNHPESAKLDEVVKQVKARDGKPGIVFTHNLDTVEAIRKKLEAEGIRVVTISGSDSSAEKDRKRKMFQPEGGGEPQADIIVASDAASTGMNAQRGQYLIQYDTPNTAMTHAQRRARIHRTGQKNNIELVDLVADHPSERKARERLAKKYQLRDLTTSELDGLDDTGLAYFIKQRQLNDSQNDLF